MSTSILEGDCREVLKTLESESAQCVVTSPPYYALRDCGVAGQIGLEQNNDPLYAVEDRGFDTPCWISTKRNSVTGYGVTNLRGKQESTHTYMYEIQCGRVGEGRELHHRCFQRACCNPSHLLRVTPKEHRALHRKSVCKEGHPLEGDNLSLYTDSNGYTTRTCVTCRRAKASIKRAERYANGYVQHRGAWVRRENVRATKGST